jgi:myo-inositol 2-dehydrogenase/D-chiro-inositol 1-dehydrogenase
MINLCLFGAGRIGSIHAACVNQHADVSILYVVDVYEPAAQKLAQKCGATVTDIQTALADPEINGVIIASSTDTHADLIERAALAGKAIFCEKPIDLDIDRVRSCLKLVEETGVLCAIGFNRRFDPQFKKAKQAIEESRVGQVEIISITSRDPSPPPAEYIKVSGGLFRDMMIHDFDMARWLLNEEFVEVFATASCLVDPAIGEAGDVDSALVTLKTASGILCQINNSRRAVYGYDQRIEVFGSKGMVQANNNLESNLVLTGEHGSLSEKPQHFFLERYAQAYRLELDNYVSCLRGEAVPVATAADGMYALLLADAALKSIQTGRAVLL